MSDMNRKVMEGFCANQGAVRGFSKTSRCSNPSEA